MSVVNVVRSILEALCAEAPIIEGSLGPTHAEVSYPSPSPTGTLTCSALNTVHSTYIVHT